MGKRILTTSAKDADDVRQCNSLPAWLMTHPVINILARGPVGADNYSADVAAYWGGERLSTPSGQAVASYSRKVNG